MQIADIFCKSTFHTAIARCTSKNYDMSVILHSLRNSSPCTKSVNREHKFQGNLMRTHLLTFITVFTLFLSPFAMASSGGGFGQGGYSQKKVDQQYEIGRSYYKGKQADGSTLTYCIKKGDSLSKLSRKSVKPYKKGTVSAFVDSLYSCADPDVKISELVGDSQGQAILYYLNKRFKLRLKQG